MRTLFTMKRNHFWKTASFKKNFFGCKMRIPLRQPPPKKNYLFQNKIWQNIFPTTLEWFLTANFLFISKNLVLGISKMHFVFPKRYSHILHWSWELVRLASALAGSIKENRMKPYFCEERSGTNSEIIWEETLHRLQFCHGRWQFIICHEQIRSEQATSIPPRQTRSTNKIHGNCDEIFAHEASVVRNSPSKASRSRRKKRGLWILQDKFAIRRTSINDWESGDQSWAHGCHFSVTLRMIRRR